MKYINFKNIGIVIFEDSETHSDIARQLGDIPVSAGFVRALSPDPLHVFGKSGSLDLNCDPYDSRVLNRLLEK